MSAAPNHSRAAEPRALRFSRPAWLAEERRFWRVAAALAFAAAILKGLRPPGAWALTQAQIDYSHGFLKRGFEGAIFSLVHLHHARSMTAVFLLQLAAMVALLVVLARRAQVEQRFGTMLPLAVAGSCYALTYLTHVIGYTDIPLAALMLLLVVIERPAVRFAAGLVAVPIAVLVHENFLLMFAPVLLFSFLLDALRTQGAARRRTLLLGAALGLLALATAVATSARPHLNDDAVDRFADEIQARVDFEIRDDVLYVLSRSLPMAWKEGTGGFRDPVWRTMDLVSLVNILPAALLLVWLAARLLRSACPHEPGTRRVLWAALLAVTFAPLLLYLLGVDGGRWNSAAYLSLAVALLLLCRAFPQAQVALSTTERNVALLVIAISLLSGGGLFGHERVNTFPFVPDIVSNFRTIPA